MRCFFVVAGLTALLVTGCATPYQNLGVLGGVKGQRLDEHRAMVSVRGNIFTNAQTAQTYVLRKAAELTVGAGYKTFKVVAVQGGQMREVMFMPTGSTVKVSGNHATAWSLGGAFTESYPDETVTIYMSNDDVPPGPDSRTYDAADVLKYVAQPPTR